jgi:hypothetical protein
MRTLTVYWIGVVIVLAVLNGILALPAGSRARWSMRNVGIAAAVLGSLAVVALKLGSQTANPPSTPDAQQNKRCEHYSGRHHASAGSID